MSHPNTDTYYLWVSTDLTWYKGHILKFINGPDATSHHFGHFYVVNDPNLVWTCWDKETRASIMKRLRPLTDIEVIEFKLSGKEKYD